MASQPSQQSQQRTQKINERRGWTAEETHSLIVWMQQHRSVLEGKKIDWYRSVAEEVFKNETHITVQKVADKVTNMKRSWKAAKELQQKSEWGIRKEDVEQSVTNLLNKKCSFFWELDDLWGTTNTSSTPASASANSNAPAPPQTSASVIGSQEQPLLAGADLVIPLAGTHDISGRGELPTDDGNEDDEEEDDDDAGGVQIEDEALPTPSNYMSVLDFRDPSSIPKSKTRQSRSQRAGRDDEESRKRKKWLDSLIESIKGKEVERLRWKEKREAQRMQLEEKRMRIHAEMERERIRSQERMAEMQVRAQEMHAQALVAIAKVFHTRVEPSSGGDGGGGDGSGSGGSAPVSTHHSVSRTTLPRGPRSSALGVDGRSDSIASTPSPAGTSSFATSPL